MNCVQKHEKLPEVKPEEQHSQIRRTLPGVFPEKLRYHAGYIKAGNLGYSVPSGGDKASRVRNLT